MFIYLLKIYAKLYATTFIFTFDTNLCLHYTKYLFQTNIYCVIIWNDIPLIE